MQHTIFLAISDMCVANEKQFMEMIYEVNRTEVSPDEVLNDTLYFYDSEKEEIQIIGNLQNHS